MFCSQSLDAASAQPCAGQQLPMAAVLAVPIERRVSLDTNPGSSKCSTQVEAMLACDLSSTVSDAAKQLTRSVSCPSSVPEPPLASSGPQWSECSSETSCISVVDDHDVFTPPANRCWKAATPKKTFSPLSAAGSDQLPHVQPDAQPHSQPPPLMGIASVLAKLPDGEHISSEYMRVQQALGKGQPSLPATRSHQQPQQQPHHQVPQPVKPQGALQKRALPCAAAAPAFDPREPFPWDPQDRLQALHEMERGGDLGSTSWASRAQRPSGSPVNTADAASCQVALDLQPSGSGSINSCWDSAASLEGFQEYHCCIPGKPDAWAAFKPRPIPKSRPAVIAWRARGLCSSQQITTPRSC